MKILDLVLKEKWFDMIAGGEKTEEYRMIKPYWCHRLSICEMNLCWIRAEGGSCRYANILQVMNPQKYTHVRFRNGYTKRSMLFELKEITIGTGNPDWGAPPYEVFIIKLGKLLEDEQ